MPDLEPPPNAVKAFGWRWRNWLNNLYEFSTKAGAFIGGGSSITTSDSPFSMKISDEVILADPDAGTITINLLPGQNGRVVKISNIKTGGAASVNISPDGTDLIQSSVGTDPGAGPLILTKGQTTTIVFVTEETAWLQI